MIVAITDGHQARVQAPYPTSCSVNHLLSIWESRIGGAVLAELLGLAQLGFAWVGLLCGDQIRYEGTYIVGLFRIRVLLLIIISFSTIALSWSKEPI
jgi:hypothetical protein